MKFFVAGVPVAKGSMKAFINRKTGKPIITATNSDLQKAWMSAIAYAAQSNGLKPEHGCAIDLYVTFYMPRPKAHYNVKGDIRPHALNLWHTTSPDADKLLRALMDSLTGIAYGDDRQVCCIEAEKSYANEESEFRTGAMIEVCQHR